ncbi:hypothetical protein OG373_15970 [Streptomyces avidinii]|uniref:hypothetical protein n=1 Tax=Streptomyces avidinii TaxID=1895 RepID=UPI0037BD9A52|nr:hypothetical protein OG592_16085 [Streptomyces avidinii]WTA97764.1 hypothetical protein OG373_15970 [Streptomyces avidinii]
MRRALPVVPAVLVPFVAALLLATSACGIRATTVPVDVGAAPSRVSCDTQPQPSGVQGFRATVELVCGSQLVGVERVIPVPEKKPVRDPLTLVAQALLEALERTPTTEERDAGFTSEVPAGLSAGAPRPGDPAGTVRLSRKPEDLPPVALSQIVCTLAGSEALKGTPGPVVLGGPDLDPPRAWECTDAVRSRPESVPTLGEIARPTPSVSPS